jgi:hypothetical protein
MNTSGASVQNIDEMDCESNRIDPQFGRCNYHLAAVIRRRLRRMHRSAEGGVQGDPDSDNYEAPMPGPSAPMPGPSAPMPGPSAHGPRAGAPFRSTTNFVYVGRDQSGCEFPRERGPRMYIVENNRIFYVRRTVQGANRFEQMDVLECEQFFEGCELFGYKYRNVIYLYGFHNHE